MNDYESLTHALPEFINTHSGADALSELETLIQDEDWTPDEDEREQHDSIVALRDALGTDWDNLTQYGGTLISEDHFTDYMRDYAEETTDGGSDNPLWNYVDWDSYADDARADFTEVEVTSGEFQGTWLYRD